jgi:hypothetical protein
LEIPVGELRAQLVQRAKARGAVASSTEKPEKSKGIVKEAIVTSETKKE